MELKTVKDTFDRATKKQKLSCSKTQEAVDRLSRVIEKGLDAIKEAPVDSENPFHHKSLVSDLKKTVQEIAPRNQLEAAHKELYMALGRYSKALEKTLSPDLSKAYRNVEFDRCTVHEIIASFLYGQGMFEVGDCFISESGESESSARKSFEEMHLILEALKRRDLGPALNWAASNSDKLKQANSDLEMQLHSLRFVEIAQDNCIDAINYMREHNPTLTKSLHKLMGYLVFIKNVEKSPYAGFLSPELWTKAVKELTRQYCNLHNESPESPLSVTVAAGSQALPPILKYMNLMANKKQEWQTMEQLPIPVELSEEFQFHSVFVCPVMKEQSREDNPAMRLCCGHVLCKQSINRMSKNGSKSFKCPYCPTDIDASQCRQLYF